MLETPNSILHYVGALVDKEWQFSPMDVQHICYYATNYRQMLYGIINNRLYN
jgi:hypothetical protein